MFPNVRLMVVAILAAITGISCGLGLFATFRVNHEPLARLAEGSPPLQLALNNRALGSEAGAPLEAGLPGKDAARLISVPVIIAAPSPAPSRTPSPAPEQSGAVSALAGDSSVQNAAAENQSKTASLAAPAEQFSTAPEAVAPGRQEAAVSDQQPAAAAATAPPTEQTATINAAAPDQQPAAKPKKADESKAARPAAKTTRSAPARRVAKTVRARQTVAQTVAQPTYQYSQPAYTQPTYP